MKKFTQLFFSLSLILLSSNFLSAQCGLPAMTLTAGSSGSNSVTFTWVAIPGAQWYGFEYKENPAGSWLSGGTLASGTSKTINGLNPLTSYQVRAQAYCGANNPGPMSNEISMTTLAGSQCSFPPSISVSAIGASTATISWPSVFGAGWYEFRYKLSSSGTWINGGTASGSATSKNFSGLAQDSDYDFQARTFCPNGVASAWSNLVQFHTVIAAPVLTVSLVNGTNATVNWLAGSGIMWYDIQYKEASSGTWLNYGTANGSSISKLVIGLNPSTTYNVRMKAYSNLLTPSPWSNTLVFTTLVATGCSLPPVLTNSVLNSTDATFTWPAVSNASVIDIQYKEVSSGTWISVGLAGTATQKVQSGLTPSTSYNLRARSICANGAPSAWATLDFTTPAASGCDLPPVYTISATTDTTVTLTWPAVANAAWFDFQTSTDGGMSWSTTQTSSGTATSKTIFGLSPATHYDIRVRSHCSNGAASAWDNDMFTTTGAMGMIVSHNNEIEESVKMTNTEITASVSMYPNPTSDYINVVTNLNEGNTTIDIKIIDMNGRIVQNLNANSIEGINTFQLNLTDLKGGIYNLEIYNNNALLTRERIIKNN